MTIVSDVNMILFVLTTEVIPRYFLKNEWLVSRKFIHWNVLCFNSSHSDGLVLWGCEIVIEGAGTMVEVVVVQVCVITASDSDLRVSLARLNFFSFALSRPALQNSSNLEFMSCSDLLAAPADGSVIGLSSMFSSSTSCKIHGDTFQ